ncbi:hypothetical protein [Streptomyces sp. NPDC046385]|uniref:hypothetical protein n=1 Tax=Streptomyces sp. NPDC046385 TaxID=3154918 RepID=UPI0033C110C4
MTRHNLARGAFAAAMGITLSVGGLAPLATAADAPAAQEVVVPATFKSTPRGGTPYLAEQSSDRGLDGAGAEGVFHTEDGLKGVQWTRYADGKSIPVTEPSTPWTSVQATGSDTLAYLREGEVELRHADGTAQTVTVPADLRDTRVYGSTVVAHKVLDAPGGGQVLAETHLLSARPDGTTRDLLVTDETGAAFPGVPFDYDETYLVMTEIGADGNPTRVALVDKETGKVSRLGAPTPKLYPMAVSPKYIVLAGAYNRATVLSRADLSAPPVVIDMGEGMPHYMDVAVVGEQLVYADNYRKVWARPIAGGDPVLLVSKSSGVLSTGPDGTAVVVGGTDATDWGLRRVTADAEGRPTVTLVKRFAPFPAKIQGIALAQGQLAVVDNSGNDGYQKVSGYLRTPAATGSGFDDRKPFLTARLPDCAPNDTNCARLLALGDGRFARFTGHDTVYDLYNAAKPGSSHEVGAPKGSTFLDAGPNQVLHGVPGTPGKNRVYDLADRTLADYAPGTGTLRNGLYWAPSTQDKGTLIGRSPSDLDAISSMAGMVPCTPRELQMVGDWIYWDCGANGTGVWDPTKGRRLPVPAGEALLGDGFVVTHDKAAGKLVLTTLNSASPVSRVVGDLPDTGVSQRNVRWAVDRFGGGLAYADAEERVHVVPSGVPAQPLSVADQRNNASTDGSKAPAPVTSLTPSKPVASWTLSVRNTTTGKVYELPGGGTTRGALTPTWGGKDTAGNPLPNGDYAWTLIAKPADGVGADLVARGTTTLRKSIPTASEAYTSVTPARVMDTRNGTGVAKAKVGPKGTVTLTVAGKGGIPATGVTAVALNLTATNATASTFVTAYPYGTAKPNASNVNVPAGKTVPNMVVVPVKDGKVTFSNNSGTVDLIADVQGYYAPGAGNLYTPLTPSRLLDTRSGYAAPKAKVQGHTTLALTVGGVGEVPVGAKSVVLNVTATNPTTGTTVSVVPQAGTTSWSGASLLNPAAGQTVSNLVVAPVVDGKVYLYNNAGAVDLLADVQGYYTNPGPGSRFEPLAPSRVLDTRTGNGTGYRGKVGSGGEILLDIAGRAGVSAADVTAVVLNVTATNATANTFITAYPPFTARPSASNLNVPKGATVSNLVVVPVNHGKITLYNHAGTTDLIADVQGYFAE